MSYAVHYRADANTSLLRGERWALCERYGVHFTSDTSHVTCKRCLHLLAEEVAIQLDPVGRIRAKCERALRKALAGGFDHDLTDPQLINTVRNAVGKAIFGAAGTSIGPVERHVEVLPRQGDPHTLDVVVKVPVHGITIRAVLQKALFPTTRKT